MPSEPIPRFEDVTHYLGVDWGKQTHHMVVLDRQGIVQMRKAVPETPKGWAGLSEALASFPTLAAAIETSCGLVVERLLDLGITVYPLNPKVAKRYRECQAPSGVKTDWRDAHSLANALRTDGTRWRALRPQDPLTQELRILCRDEIGLIQQRTAWVNQLQAALQAYYPAALDAFEDWTCPSAWDFIAAFPTPTALVQAGRRKQQKFLHVHRMGRPEMLTKRLDIFAHATDWTSPSPAVTSAKSFLAVSLVKQLRTLQTQLHHYRKRIETLFAQHPDHDVFDSLPGAGPKLAPRLLGEIGVNREDFPDPDSLQCTAGTAPVTYQSGTMRKTHIRRACRKGLRATIHLWANLSRKKCVWAEVYYRKKRAEGKHHATALRCLGQRWLKILWRMWQTRTPYDEALHTRNQTAHGSWVIALQPSSL